MKQLPLPSKKKAEFKTPDDIKDMLIQQKDILKFQDSRYYKGWGHSYTEYCCDKTEWDVILGGIGPQKIKINGYYYSYKSIFKAIHQDYKKNSKTMNPFVCLICKDYEYKNYTANDVIDLIKNRKHTQYIARSEIPKYIPLSYFEKFCREIELPILKKHYDLYVTTIKIVVTFIY